ncbi:D-alanyl-D-alanine carboxypeptidase [Flagellimonas sp. HMM57]|uniref:D-alanyl-D-alanine carboxypeptidase/D-alanyl-D-alanine-endopeptidase n=1 Tax=unclassified Flagellimonas TaxID=2644544 RepID=UPI0013CFDED7|nr:MULTISPECIES: D-alanyl-D-alanine carboxypeptidase [unclassified Flagellimonas]UII75420.1 D-alanyl-D-alanine carboxypeptidase [Flagellimonas sp. HMM57]
MKHLLYLLLVVIFLVGCTSSKKIIQKKTESALLESFFNNQFTGLLILDAQSKDTLYQQNHTKYFTPASNTKIFTLYTALKMLPDSIPALKYIKLGDSLFIEGTGDPTFLHSDFDNTTTLDFLKSHENIALHPNNFKDEKYGPGWSWGDYSYYYQPERTALPIYGNVTTLHKTDSLIVIPAYFKDKVVDMDFSRNRKKERNLFFFNPTRKDTLSIPFITDSTLTKELLINVLDKKINIINSMPEGVKSTLYSVPKDTVLRKMMQDSDNFLAEQLLVLASSTLSDTLNVSKAQNHMLENHLSYLKQVPRWVDGSGLSRYNLFTPESIVQVLDRMYSEFPRETLFSTLAVGGVSGTLENWYSGAPDPYIYAKTGTLSNNHCVSGYLLTNSGKTLIFSFMNNHYRQSTSELKQRMQSIFEYLRDTY